MAQLSFVRLMRLFPSMFAAIVTGAVGMPLLISGWKFIEASSHNHALLLLWTIIVLVIPVVLTTTDLRDIARRWREAGLFGSVSDTASRDAFRQIYLPAWTRMGAWFVSAVVSLLLLKIVRIWTDGPNCRFEFDKRSQLFICSHNETLFLAAMRVSNEDCSHVGTYGCDTAPTPTGRAEIVSDDLPVIHWRRLQPCDDWSTSSQDFASTSLPSLASRRGEKVVTYGAFRPEMSYALVV
jgi:hypothetical protein